MVACDITAHWQAHTYTYTYTHTHTHTHTHLSKSLWSFLGMISFMICLTTSPSGPDSILILIWLVFNLVVYKLTETNKRMHTLDIRSPVLFFSYLRCCGCVDAWKLVKTGIKSGLGAYLQFDCFCLWQRVDFVIVLQTRLTGGRWNARRVN